MTTCSKMHMTDSVLVKAVTISAKSRHKQDRRNVTILLPLTDVVLSHYWTGFHRDFVKSELLQLGLNSCSHFISLTCFDGTVLHKDDLELLLHDYLCSKSLTNSLL